MLLTNDAWYQIGLECGAYAPGKPAGSTSGRYAHRHIGCAIFYRKEKMSIESAKRVYLR